MRMFTIKGYVWDNTHIISKNISLVINGIDNGLIGKSGYFLLLENKGVKFLVNCCVSQLGRL